MKLQKIIEIIETIAPAQDACEWDNVGLMIGSPDNEISKIVISLDFDDNAVEYAVNHKADLIITHHPAIFKPLKNITDQCIIKAIKNDISVFSAHTNLDAAIGGVNFALADKLGMYDCTQYGMMRVGYVTEEKYADIIGKVKQCLEVSALRIVGDVEKSIRKIAVIGGAGGDFVNEAYKLGCDLLITGECKYDQAQNAFKTGISLISAGHFETENPVVSKLCKILQNRLNIDVEEVTPRNIFEII